MELRTLLIFAVPILGVPALSLMPDYDDREQERLGSLTCERCGQIMRLVGRESPFGTQRAELLTFECDCGYVAAVTTDQ